MKKQLSILMLSATFTLNICAQSLERSVIASSGNSFSNATAQLDFTIGEAITTTLLGGSNLLTQGFQQPNNTTTGITSFEKELLKIEAFPNPTESQLNLRITTETEINFTATVYDITGRKMNMELKDFAKENYATVLNVTNLSAGAYFIEIVNNEKQQIGLVKFQKL